LKNKGGAGMTTKINILKKMAVAAVITLVMGAVSATAAPIATGVYVEWYLKQNTFPSGLSEQQVYLDDDEAYTIIGHVGSQTGSTLVNFSSTTDTLDAASGFSNIKAVDGFLNNITITAPGYWFEDLIFSVNLTPNSNTDLSVMAVDRSGGDDTYTNWADQGLGPGENRILVLSTEGNLMQSVTIESQIGFESLGGLDQLKQTEISGLTPVPEPATMLLLGSGFIGLVGYGRKKLLAHRS
jgi:hypothetical protein